MCGFTVVAGARASAPEDIQRFRNASERLSTRGNSDKGEWHGQGIHMFHYRLAFRDVNAAHQPMRDPWGDCTLVFNGELYDLPALRSRIGDFPWQTKSDTEVLLAAWRTWGSDMQRHLDGEYAYVLWDSRENLLIAGRDPFGVKPLYLFADDIQQDYFRTWQDTYSFSCRGQIAFASEIKGIPFPLRWEKEGFTRQFCSLYEEIATPFAGVLQVPPGSICVFKRAGDRWQCRIERKINRRRQHDQTRTIPYTETAMQLRGLVDESVQQRLDSDVPLGVYLSGGVDSRVIADRVLQHTGKADCFTVGFSSPDYDESQAVSAFLRDRPNATGHLLRTSDASLEYSYPHAIYASELIQPYTNGCAKWWLSRFTRRYVQGVLTGDGADEMFCGYPSYRYLAWWQFLQRNPKSKARRSFYAARTRAASAKPWELGVSTTTDGSDLEQAMKHFGWVHPLYGQIHAVGSYLFSSSSAMSTWLQDRRETFLSYVAPDQRQSALTQWQNYFFLTHFPVHVLNWVGDRMEMANTLEGRPPLLSRKILHIMQGMPDHYLVRGMRDKAVLRKAFQEYLQGYANVPKKQFNAPFLHKTKLGQQFLNTTRLESSGLIDPKGVVMAQKTLQEEKDPLTRSFADIFLQNTIVTMMIDEYLVQGRPPVRDHAWENDFIEKNTEVLQ